MPMPEQVGIAYYEDLRDYGHVIAESNRLAIMYLIETLRSVCAVDACNCNCGCLILPGPFPGACSDLGIFTLIKSRDELIAGPIINDPLTCFLTSVNSTRQCNYVNRHRINLSVINYRLVTLFKLTHRQTPNTMVCLHHATEIHKNARPGQ